MWLRSIRVKRWTGSTTSLLCRRLLPDAEIARTGETAYFIVLNGLLENSWSRAALRLLAAMLLIDQVFAEIG